MVVLLWNLPFSYIEAYQLSCSVFTYIINMNSLTSSRTYCNQPFRVLDHWNFKADKQRDRRDLIKIPFFAMPLQPLFSSYGASTTQTNFWIGFEFLDGSGFTALKAKIYPCYASKFLFMILSIIRVLKSSLERRFYVPSCLSHPCTKTARRCDKMLPKWSLVTKTPGFLEGPLGDCILFK